MIKAAMDGNFVFQMLPKRTVRMMIDVMEGRQVDAHTTIIKQGDKGDYFYVIEEGSCDVFVDHLLPRSFCIWKIMLSSSDVQPPFLTDGSKWLNQCSRHCLPVRPGSDSATIVHFILPTGVLVTRSTMI